MSIWEKTKQSLRCVYRSVVGPEIEIDRYVGKAFWVIGLACCSYWLWRWGVLLWPGRQLSALLGLTTETTDLQALLFSGLAFITLFVLFVFALFAVSLLTDKSPREFLSSQRQFVYRVLHWLCVGSTFTTFLFVLWFVGKSAFIRASLWDAWAQSVVFAVLGFPVSILLHYLIKYWRRGKPLKHSLHGPFRPSSASSLTALFVAVWYSYFCIYPLMIAGAYSNLQSAYENCNVFSDAVMADPFLPAKWFQEGDKSQPLSTGIYRPSNEELDLLYRVFKYMGIVKAASSFEDFQGDPQFSEDIPYFFQRDIVDGGSLSEPVYMAKSLLDSAFSSVEFASVLAYRKGGGTVHAASEGDRLRKCLAANLAGAPNCQSSWNHLNGSDDNEKHGIFELRPFGIPTAVSDSDIVRHLLEVTSGRATKEEVVPNRNQTLSDLIKNVEDATSRLDVLKKESPQDPNSIATAEMKVAEAKASYAGWKFFSSSENEAISARLLEETLARTHSAPQVKSARYFVALVQGAEQLGMLILGVWMAGLLAVRCRNMFGLSRMREWLEIAKPDSGRSMSADEVKAFVTRLFALESADDKVVHEDVETRFERIRRVNFEGRWMLRWIAQALPAIGFIGTVRGISAGLGSADAIVRADNVIEQASAINQVAGSLGIAFTTTLVALVFGLVLGILERLQASFENGMLSRLETACVVGSAAEEDD